MNYNENVTVGARTKHTRYMLTLIYGHSKTVTTKNWHVYSAWNAAWKCIL